ncbi:MAG: hypothetical protein HOO08_00315 [Opitutae bacterium]|nr:hypothetical protein [Opitutae bacterium]
MTWESEGQYQYKIEGSTDNQQWTLLVDQTGNTQSAATTVDTLKDAGVLRFMRVIVTDVPNNQWPSIREVSLR